MSRATLAALLVALSGLGGCYLSHPVQPAPDAAPPVLVDERDAGDSICDPATWGACDHGTGECIEIGARCGVAAGCYDVGAGERRCRLTCRLDQADCLGCTPSGFMFDGVPYGFCP